MSYRATSFFVTLIVACLGLLISGCTRGVPSQVFFIDNRPFTSTEADKLEKKLPFEKQFQALSEANPTNDAAIYFGRGDTRLILIMGIGPDIPMSAKLSIFSERDLMKPERTKLIWGTGTDFIKDKTQGKVRDLAWKYAKNYNDHMLLLLEQN